MAFARIPGTYDAPTFHGGPARRDYSKAAFRGLSPDVPDTYRNRAKQGSQYMKGDIAGAESKTRPGDFPMQGQIPDAVLPDENYGRDMRIGRRVRSLWGKGTGA
jgi:hypothetical protein